MQPEKLQKKDWTAFKKGVELLYKKLCFAYADATRKKLILIRTDISSVVNERKLREKEERKRVACLENMPVACAPAEVLLDPDGVPYGFLIAYSNQAYAKLVGVEVPELLKRNFYEVFPDMDRKRLPYLGCGGKEPAYADPCVSDRKRAFWQRAGGHYRGIFSDQGAAKEQGRNAARFGDDHRPDI